MIFSFSPCQPTCRLLVSVGNDLCSAGTGDARINFTFRSAPNILGEEHEYETGSFWVDPS